VHKRIRARERHYCPFRETTSSTTRDRSIDSYILCLLPFDTVLSRAEGLGCSSLPPEALQTSETSQLVDGSSILQGGDSDGLGAFPGQP
jgi:hypothetical protein